MTSRQHQLRANLYRIYHRRVGDPLYRDRHDASAHLPLMLHARQVERLRDAGAGL